MSSNLDKVIVALDYTDPYKAFQLIDEVGDLINWFKVGPVLFTRSGNEVIQFLHKRSKKIFLDLKLFDTPIVVGQTIRQIGDLGVQFTTVHCAGGAEMLESAASNCRGSTLKILGLTLLTTHTAQQSQSWSRSQSDLSMVVSMVEQAAAARLAGVLCSPHELKEARDKSVPGFLLVAPGIRLPGNEVFQDDQKRVASPNEALSCGADYLIVGRPITQARSPREVVEKLFA